MGLITNKIQKREMTSLIRLKLQGVFVSLLIDSGAARSAIDLDFAKSLGIKIENLEKGELKFLQAANQTRVEIVGKCNLELQFNSNKLNYEFLVMQNLSVRCLVGIDFLESFKVKQDYSTGVVTILGLGDIDFIRRDDYLGLVRLSKPIRLQPNKMTIVPVSISGGTNARLGNIRDLSSPIPNVKIMGFVQREGKETNLLQLMNHGDKSLRLKNWGPIAVMVKNTNSSNTDQLNFSHENGRVFQTNLKTIKIESDDVAGAPFSVSNSAPCKINDACAIVPSIESNTMPKVDTLDQLKTVLQKHPRERTFQDLGLKIDNEKVSDFDKRSFVELIEKNSDIFALTQKEIGCFNLYEVDLEPKDESPPPIKTKLYPQSKEARQEIERQVLELLETRIIEL